MVVALPLRVEGLMPPRVVAGRLPRASVQLLLVTLRSLPLQTDWVMTHSLAAMQINSHTCWQPDKRRSIRTAYDIRKGRAVRTGHGICKPVPWWSRRRWAGPSAAAAPARRRPPARRRRCPRRPPPPAAEAPACAVPARQTTACGIGREVIGYTCGAVQHKHCADTARLGYRVRAASSWRDVQLQP